MQREFPASPLVSVGAVVLDKQNRVLLIQRGSEPLKGHWSLPGGLVELGETLLDALTREVFEETGVIFKPQAIVDVVDRIYTKSDGEDPVVRYHYVIVDYWGRALDGEICPATDVTAACWASREDWIDSNTYELNSITVQVIEKGWQLAQGSNLNG